MKSVNFYSFQERVPSHREKIHILQCDGSLVREFVSYPSKDSPNVYKDEYYIIADIFGVVIPYEEYTMYCIKKDISQLLNK